MGLDWCLPDMIGRPGFKTEFYELRRRLRELSRDDPRCDGYLARLAEIGLRPIDELDVPRIGIEPEATKWFAQQVEDLRAESADVATWRRPFEQLVDESFGRPVLPLCKPCLGIPKFVAFCDPLGFRGNVIFRFREFLPTSLLEEAYEDHTDAEAASYAEALHFAALDVPQYLDAACVHSAVEWLRFWSSRGYGFTASY